MNALIVDTSPARLALDRADAAYTLAVEKAAHDGGWPDVRKAGAKVHQARAALKEAEDHQ